ncbi:fumarylacetoacetate hydrolase family protein [Donghicola eburneus]|uniref:fumarylacetoacetate hydrolase family protein n=1 Tax=Donghicola eburneus TaxID=393278 RepID=UPI0008E6EB4F|nr:fumarylacetoacetate hydrolase family protein [Donghicola eburneus]SFQ75892.1 fumarylpyruvate hydrolase [Donghicola eburneus]
MSDTPTYAFEPPAIPSLPIAGEEVRFPIRRIYCVGRNYADHAREMGHDPNREPPFFFSKPADSVTEGGQEVPYPPQTADLHYEGELVVCLGSGGRDLDLEAAERTIFGYAVGNDLTRRDMQSEAKSLKRPWDLSKGFDGGAVIGPVKRHEGVLSKGAIQSYVNGKTRQSGDLNQMIWNIPEVISALSHSIELRAGDLIMTGTPAGVGSLAQGDVVTVEIEGLGRIETKIV